jgi:transposase InsO family protein
MESFFSSLKTERTARKVYRSRDRARADVFDYIERFYNPRRRHSTISYLSPMDWYFSLRVAVSGHVKYQVKNLARCELGRCREEVGG